MPSLASNFKVPDSKHIQALGTHLGTCKTGLKNFDWTFSCGTKHILGHHKMFHITAMPVIWPYIILELQEQNTSLVFNKISI